MKKMNSNPSVLRERVIIFGRFPVPGRTKTRLIPALGAVGAAEFHRRLTEKILKTVKTFAILRKMDVEFCFEGDGEQEVRRWLGSGPILSRQVQGNLGDRMHTAFFDSFQTGAHRVVLLGTDIWQLKVEHLKQSFDALVENDLVIGPSTDGGYWLIGMNQPFDLFEGIKWSTDVVLDQTLSLAKKQGLRFKTLSPLDDIDTEEDLKQVLSINDWQNKYKLNQTKR